MKLTLTGIYSDSMFTHFSKPCSNLLHIVANTSHPASAYISSCAKQLRGLHIQRAKCQPAWEFYQFSAAIDAAAPHLEPTTEPRRCFDKTLCSYCSLSDLLLNSQHGSESNSTKLSISSVRCCSSSVCNACLCVCVCALQTLDVCAHLSCSRV